VSNYLLKSFRSRGGATAAGAEALRAVAPRSVEKDSVRISTEPFFSGSPGLDIRHIIFASERGIILKFKKNPDLFFQFMDFYRYMLSGL